MKKLYEQIENYIENYTSKDGFDWEEFFDGWEKSVKEIYPDNEVAILSWEVDNDTFEIDVAFDTVLDFMKQHYVVDYSTNWDAEKENLQVTIVYQKD